MRYTTPTCSRSTSARIPACYVLSPTCPQTHKRPSRSSIVLEIRHFSHGEHDQISHWEVMDVWIVDVESSRHGPDMGDDMVIGGDNPLQPSSPDPPKPDPKPQPKPKLIRS